MSLESDFVTNNKKDMTESFLHYLWKYRMLNPGLAAVSGETITILYPGDHNRDGGPDFINARIRIGETVWAGNVEIHVSGSDWYRHNHQSDNAYDNIILHVVYNNDVVVTDRRNNPVTTLVVQGSFPVKIFERYEGLLRNRLWIPCEKLIGGLDPVHFERWAPSLAVERLEEKTGIIRKSWEECRNGWNEAFWRNLARCFGFKINASPFEMLAETLPLKILVKHRNSLFQLEALLYGQSGMLAEKFRDPYPVSLSKEFKFLGKKCSLQPLPGFLWQFLRLRPSNFPTVRIAQLAALIYTYEDLLGLVLGADTPGAIHEAFGIRASEYWDDHFMFDRGSVNHPKMLGSSSINLLILNFIIPFFFFYGKERGKPVYKEKGMQWLELIEGESNAEIGRLKKLGLAVDHALHTQALIQLKSRYCNRKRCLECRLFPWFFNHKGALRMSQSNTKK